MPQEDQVKSRQILHDLKSDIVSGKLKPGERLPTRTELIQRFAASSVTIQKACHVLLREGFIVTAGARGSFVADNPPHIQHVGLAFIGHPRTGGVWWTRFHDVLLTQIQTVQQRTSHVIKPYYNVQGLGDGSARRELLEDIRERRLSGVIFAGGLFDLDHHPVITSTHLPLATIAAAHTDKVRAVYVDFDSFLQQSVELLARSGRRRIALVGIQEPDSGATQSFAQLAHQFGMETREAWVQTVWPQMALGARPIVQLLMDKANPNRPDALIVSDDNLIEHACEGLKRAGVSVGPGKDCEVVVHANFPQPVPTDLPVRRVGFDVGRLLEMLIEELYQPKPNQKIAGMKAHQLTATVESVRV